MSAPITLDRGDYWELMAAQKSVELAKLEAQQRVAAAVAHADAVFQRLAPIYALDAAARYRTNDATCHVANYVPGAGSLVFNMTAACTGETSVGFVCFN